MSDAALWDGDVPQARAVAEGGATVTAVTRTHNTFTVEVEAPTASRILLDSGYDRGWQSNVGTVVEVSHELALDVPAGHHKIRMRYWPEKLTLGLVISGLGLSGSLLFLFRHHLARWLKRDEDGDGARRGPGDGARRGPGDEA